jgi:uncharacterized protein (DUF342 family)
MAKKKLLIDREAFCDWYFDHDICKDFFYRHDILPTLKSDGVFKVSLKEILDGVGYLPADVVAEGQEPILDEHDEVDVSAYDSITFAKTEMNTKLSR